jgi:hypothetical protein
MNTRTLMHLEICHCYDPIPQRVIIFTIEFLVQSVHNVSTALVIESATVVSLKQSLFLSLDCPSVDLFFLVFPLSLYTNSHLLDVLVGPYNLSGLLLFLFVALFDPFPIYLLFFIRAIIFEVLEFLLDLLILTVLLAILIFLFIIIFLLV